VGAYLDAAKTSTAMKVSMPMLKTKPAKEVTVRLQNEIGALDAVAKTIADKGINILAVCTWVEGAQAVVRLVTDDSVRAADALRARNFETREMDVLVMEAAHKPGMLRRITEKLAKDELDIHHFYATANMMQETSFVVLATANNDRAMVRLNA
jgi:hypothetical protein